MNQLYQPANPFHDSDSAVLLQNILTANTTYPKELSKDLVDLLKKMFETNPKTRITINQIKVHPWFKINFNPIKGSFLDKSKSNENNINYITEDEEDKILEFNLKNIDKDVIDNYVKHTPVLNCFEMATLLSGKWVNTMFSSHSYKNLSNNINNNNVFEMTLYVCFNFLIKENMESYIGVLQKFLNINEKNIKFCCIAPGHKVSLYIKIVFKTIFFILFSIILKIIVLMLKHFLDVVLSFIKPIIKIKIFV